MYLKEIKIWDFRKFGTKEGGTPGVTIPFHKNFNLLIGENDAGKSTIIDAIKLVLGTSSEDNLRITEEDFHIDNNGEISKEIKIECIFSGLTPKEAGIFLEWLSFDENGDYNLKVRLIAKKVQNNFLGERIEKNIKAGSEESAVRIDGLARELIRATYLKPLRDAANELKPGFKSRLAQILKSHKAFKLVDGNEKHVLEQILDEANQKIEKFFDEPYEESRTIKTDLINYLDEFFHLSKEDRGFNPDFNIVKAKLNDILKRLSLVLNDKPSGLGSLNLLFIATELLLYNDEQIMGAKLTLIEEIEAHLHPQAQLRLVKYLQNRSENSSETAGQFILTTHSTTLAASTKLEHTILLHNNIGYPLGSRYTMLDKEDYKFLERFLDSTKANMFFAKGVIFVEGDAENLLLPTIAEIIDRPLYKYGISIVNIGNTAFNRYAKIYKRSEEWLQQNPPLNVPVAIITDVDIRPIEYYQQKNESNNKVYVIQTESHLENIAFILDIDKEDIRGLINVPFSSKKNLKEFLESYNIVVSDNKKNEIAELITTELTIELIDSLKKNKKNLIKNEFNESSSSIKAFVAPNWTLEYELALSQLDKQLIYAVHNSRYSDPQSEKNLKKLSDRTIAIEELQGHNEKKAFMIYKPLLNKSVSKATTAQELAIILNQNKDKLKDIITTDPYLEYLRDAIYHVTGGKE